MIIDMGGGTVDMTIHKIDTTLGGDAVSLSELTHRECLAEVGSDSSNTLPIGIAHHCSTALCSLQWCFAQTVMQLSEHCQMVDSLTDSDGAQLLLCRVPPVLMSASCSTWLTPLAAALLTAGATTLPMLLTYKS